MPEWFGASDLLLAGGWVMLAILVLSFVMWLLILDRYVSVLKARRRLVADSVRTWQDLSAPGRLVNARLRRALGASFEAELGRGMLTIEVITAVLPLLGLLGTVIGMIKTFDVMTAFGTGNVRGMAEGISQALVTTMAGLVTALAGMYCVGDLKARIVREGERLRQHLVAPSTAWEDGP